MYSSSLPPPEASYKPVHGKGCTSYVNMDDARYGRPGGQYTVAQCAAAVKKLDGREGCIANFFFFESAGYCNCPKDDCDTSANTNAGSKGQLYEFSSGVFVCACVCVVMYVVTTHRFGQLGVHSQQRVHKHIICARISCRFLITISTHASTPQTQVVPRAGFMLTINVSSTTKPLGPTQTPSAIASRRVDK